MQRIAVAIFLFCSAAAHAESTPICDDDWTIKPHESQAQSFELSKEGSVLIDIRGVKHTDKGFTVHVIKQDVWDGYRAGTLTEKAVNDADSEKATSVNRVRRLPAGKWVVVVKNSENAFERMTVHAKIVLNPKEQ